MTASMRFKVPAAALAAFTAAASFHAAASASSPRFFDDDPISIERDTESAEGMKPLEVDLVVDLATNLLSADQIERSRAQNVNTIDEVPDSSWFTNRVGRRPITPADVAKGPDTIDGPAPGRWTITSSKSDGVTPGFTIKDATGQRWFLKFDPPGYRGMATGSEVVATKLMWALGYNVPENHIAYMRREQLAVGEGSTFTPPGARKRALRIGDVDRLLERAEREPDGSYRIVASKALEGKPIGRIRFHGTRPDDPNDVVPHEHRRELRAYGVFAAWLNHVDAKAINSLDTLVTEHGRTFVRHHLIDFGSSLGSGGVAPADYWAGSEYLVQPRSIVQRIAGFGFVRPGWQRAPFYESRAIGRLPRENSDFNPDLWKPRVPNRAFLHARADDKFWAAERLVAITTDMLRAAVRAGDFRDPAAEAFLVNALAERRDAIARAYLSAVNPIVNLVIDAGGNLTFGNAAVDADVAREPAAYRATWSSFDNATGASVLIGETSAHERSLPLPGAVSHTAGAFLKVTVSAIGSAHPAWNRPVDAYFRLRNGAWTLVGFERMPG